MTRFLSKIKLEHWVLIGAFLGILVFQALPGPRPLDDAYITYRYARSISQVLIISARRAMINEIPTR
jgi:hypothetical protein